MAHIWILLHTISQLCVLGITRTGSRAWLAPFAGNFGTGNPSHTGTSMCLLFPTTQQSKPWLFSTCVINMKFKTKTEFLNRLQRCFGKGRSNHISNHFAKRHQNVHCDTPQYFPVNLIFFCPFSNILEFPATMQRISSASGTTALCIFVPLPHDGCNVRRTH